MSERDSAGKNPEDRPLRSGAVSEINQTCGVEPNASPIVDYLTEDDAFYWMQGECEADIPLSALGFELPLGCRFCI
ncbi:MAG: hypothetical protein PHO53_05240 [Actinomycetota bacterium]|nr:hypothetical protein [Actinomycetota bacterium]